MSFIKKIGLVCFIVFCCAGCRSAGEKLVESAAAPRIINIINFIRQTDYRVENADSLLYETVCEQVKLVNKWHSCISPWQYNHVIQRLWTL